MMFSVRARPSGDASRRAGVLAAAVVCLLLVKDVAYAADPVLGGGAAQVPFVVAVFVIPLLFAFRGPRLVLARGRWPVLAVQTVLTWVPFAIFGGRWQVGLGGLLAGLVLLTVPGLVSWLVAGSLLAADVAVRAGVVGLPVGRPGWLGALWVAVTFTDLGLAFFGVIRLAQLVGELREAQDQHAGLAVAAERLQAAGELQTAVGERLDGIAAMAAAARQALARDPGQARAQVTATGSAARQAAAQARAIAVSGRALPQAGPAAPPQGGAVIGARLAWAVLVVVLCGYATAAFIDAAEANYSPRRTALLAAGIAASMLVQLHHSRAARQGRRPRAWPVTLGLQAVLAYVFFLPPLGAFFTLTPFLAGSVLLLVPGRWRWAGYVAVVVSWPAVYATVPLPGAPASYRGALEILYLAGSIAGIGLLVYALSRLAGTAAELEAVDGELARMAAVRERLRVARDVHDLLGLGLSAIALKADLVGKLIGRDDERAAAEIGELARTCAAARADIRLVTGGGQQLSLATELAAAGQILASAGVQVHARMPAGPLPAAADAVLAVVLREAVTNILRHSAATSCTIEAADGDGGVRMAVSNDGVTGQAGPPGDGSRGAGGGSGLANLTARVQAAGGQLSARRASGSFELTVQIPRPGPGAVIPPAQAQARGLGAHRPAGGR